MFISTSISRSFIANWVLRIPALQLFSVLHLPRTRIRLSEVLTSPSTSSIYLRLRNGTVSRTGTPPVLHILT